MTARRLTVWPVPHAFATKSRRALPRLRERHGRPPGLGVVLAGQNPASEVYVRNKLKTVGEPVAARSCSGSTTRRRSTTRWRSCGGSTPTRRSTGSWCSRRCRTGMGADAEQRVFDAIDPAKDVDGFHPLNVGLLVQKRPAWWPARRSAASSCSSGRAFR